MLCSPKEPVEEGYYWFQPNDAHYSTVVWVACDSQSGELRADDVAHRFAGRPVREMNGIWSSRIGLPVGVFNTID